MGALVEGPQGASWRPVGPGKVGWTGAGWSAGMTLGMATASAVTIGRASCGAAVGGWTAAFSAVSKARVSSGSDDIIAARRPVLSAGGERMSSARMLGAFA